MQSLNNLLRAKTCPVLKMGYLRVQESQYETQIVLAFLLAQIAAAKIAHILLHSLCKSLFAYSYLHVFLRFLCIEIICIAMTLALTF